MILVIDIGNSNIVLAAYEGMQKLFATRLPSGSGVVWTVPAMRREMKRYLSECRQGEAGGALAEGAVISSVVPRLTPIVSGAAEQLCGGTPLIVGSHMNTGLRIEMDAPERVGADLLADACAAARDYTGALAVFDMGTATTCSVITENRAYIATLILPGVHISMQALSSRCAQLPDISLEERPPVLLAKNTADSMRAGIIYSNAAAVDGLLMRLEQELGVPVTAVATGGIAPLIVPYCRKSVFLDEDLMLRGMRYLYDLNRYPVD